MPGRSGSQLRDLLLQSLIPGALCREGLIHSQRIFAMALMQVQLRHRFGQHRLRLREGRGIGRPVVIRQVQGWRWLRAGDHRRLVRGRCLNVFRHDERQILRGFQRSLLGRQFGVHLEQSAALVLRARQPLDLHFSLRLYHDRLVEHNPLGRGRLSRDGLEIHTPIVALKLLRRIGGGRRGFGRSLQLEIGFLEGGRRCIGDSGVERAFHVFDREPRWPGSRRGGVRSPELQLFVLDLQRCFRRRRLQHDGIRWLHRGGGFGRRGGRLGAHARQSFGRLTVHRIGQQQAIEPLHPVVEAFVALGDFREDLQRENILGIEIEHAAKYFFGGDVVLLVDQAAPVYDVTADVVRVELQTGLTQFDRVIYKPCFAIRVRQGGEVPSLGVFAVARFELLDFAGVGHSLSLCGNWSNLVISRASVNLTAPRELEFVRCRA